MGVKKMILAGCLMVLLILPATKVFAFGFERTITLGALGTALGFAIGGDARDAAIGGAAGLVTGMVLETAHPYHTRHRVHHGHYGRGVGHHRHHNCGPRNRVIVHRHHHYQMPHIYR